jgi:nitroreductase
MDFYDVIKTRRSARQYRPDPIPKDVLNRVLHAARLAPSGSNRQPTRYVLVEDQEARKQLAELCHNQRFIAEAPVVIVACGGKIPSNRGGYMGRYSMLVDVAIAVDHLTLAARAEGLGTCWIGAFDNAAIKDSLGVPEEVQVVAITPLGYPQGDPFKETQDRLPLSELVCKERWGF